MHLKANEVEALNSKILEFKSKGLVTHLDEAISTVKYSITT